MIIKFITQIQRNIRVQIQKVRSDNGTKFKNEKLKSHYEQLGIMHQTSIARMPQQNDSSEDSNETPSTDNLFGPLYKEYYETRSPEVSTNSAATTLNNEETPSSSLIIVEDNEAPQIVSSLEEPNANEPTTLVSDDTSDESI
ncbi:retrovirus-related pol polyprotein from transposon TNT 1-94 [Tanacetum coccineum]